MIGFAKRKSGLIVALAVLLLGLPFFHYHPDNSHTHPSELSQHTHQGHFHSNELNGFVRLIGHDAKTPWQEEEHHSHSDTDSETNYFEVTLQKSSVHPIKTFKTFKSGNTQKPFFVSEPASFHPFLQDLLDFEYSGLRDTPKERSPPLRFV